MAAKKGSHSPAAKQGSKKAAAYVAFYEGQTVSKKSSSKKSSSKKSTSKK